MLSTLGSLQAQTTFTITIPQDVATKEWVQDYVKKKIDSLNAIQHAPFPPCTQGPEIREIITASKDYLTVKFHGVNVTSLDYIIFNNAQIRTGRLKPESSTIKFSFKELPTGTYSLTLSGGMCTGSDTKTFKIKNNTL
ncbi:hypothetical protein [Dyadobacter bucti]|uniref:hypothetical protein n=1 Tax=Dyadobacter bucti TaxID=2572203 RepID=UPI001108F61A|nr:hypothetical protein [Dyadobacter bucti]